MTLPVSVYDYAKFIAPLCLNCLGYWCYKSVRIIIITKGSVCLQDVFQLMTPGGGGYGEVNTVVSV